MLCLYSAVISAETENTISLNMSVGGYPPFTLTENEGPGGIMWDVLEPVANQAGYALVPMEVPRKRVDDFVENGRLDVSPRAVEWTRDPERFIFSDPVLMTQEVFFARASDDFRFNSLEDLKGKTIITNLGYFYPELEPLFASGKAKRFDIQSHRAMFRHLKKSGDFDLVIAEEKVGQWIIRQNGWEEDFVIAGKALSERAHRLMFNRKWEPFVERFNNALTEMRATSELDRILEKYHSPPPIARE